MNNPKVSIMIPTYKQAQVLGRAIESALAQSYPHLEVVVADDNSPDHTSDVIKPYQNDKRIRYFRNSNNLGRVGNYRKALYDYATGVWVLNLDGDDYLTNPMFIEKAVDVLTTAEDVVLLIGGQRFLEPDGLYRDCQSTTNDNEVLSGLEFFLRWRKPTDTVPHLASLYHRATAMQLGFYTQDINSSDWESLRRLTLHGNVVLVNDIAGTWMGHESNTSKTLTIETHLDNLLSITEPYTYAKQCLGEQPFLQTWQRQALAEYAQFYINMALDQAQFKNAWRFLNYIRNHHPGSFISTLSKLAINPKFYARVLLALAGSKAARSIRKLWLQKTWKHE